MNAKIITIMERFGVGETVATRVLCNLKRQQQLDSLVVRSNNETDRLFTK